MARPRYKRNHKERTYEEQKEHTLEKKKCKRPRCLRREKEEGK